MIAWIRSLLFAVIFYTLSVLIGLLVLPVAGFNRPAARATAHIWTRLFLWMTRWMLGIRLQVEGRPPGGQALYAFKHQSMFETMALVPLLDAPLIVLKQELADIPIWGFLAQRYGVVAVDREGSARALRAMLAGARALIGSGRAICIFPEGTRVQPGETPPLRPGFAGLYRALGLPVVPVAVESGAAWGARRFVKQPAVVRIRFGEPIAPGLSRADIEARVHRAINAFENQSSRR